MLRNILTTALFLCAVLLVEAGRNNNSALTIRFSDKGNYLIILNDADRYETEHVFSVQGISAGDYNVRILNRIQNPYANGDYNQLVYDGNINIPEGAKVTATLRVNGVLDVHSIEALHQKSLGLKEKTNRMPDEDFKELISIVSRVSSDQSRFDMIRKAVNANGASNDQIIELAKLLHSKKLQSDMLTAFNVTIPVNEEEMVQVVTTQL